MILPWFGHIGKSHKSCAGYSNPTGFSVVMFMPLGLKKLVHTKHFDPKNEMLESYGMYFWIVKIMASIIGAYLMEQYLLPSRNSYILASAFFATTAMSIYMLMPTTFFMLFWYNRDMTQWHSCEHRAVVLLESNADFTKQNLMKSPAAMIRCGSVQEIIRIQIWVSLSFLLYAWAGQSAILFYYAMASVTSVIFATFALSLFFTFHPQSITRLIVFIMPFFLPAFPALLLPMLFQRAVMLANPTPEKIEETLEMLHRYREEHPVIKLYG
ncbi:MAG: hypothetical protein U1A23_05145 [Candidatus Sungbacteria bacterium]|nr:hypothetical protein [bacterium]MDZ4286289.1 hypothetical protein [Candidatus Sungbacteria bacterium]